MPRTGRPPTPADVRFWRCVDKGAGVGNCWLWTKGKDKDGYGKFSHGPSGRRRHIHAHRFSWEFHFGPIPPELLVCHKCDTPSCVNPACLFLGTCKENLIDAATKGRMSSRFSADQVRDIRRLYATGDTSISRIADANGVSFSAIQNITSNRTWKHL